MTSSRVPTPTGLSWAAVVIALAAFAVAISGIATGRPGEGNTPRAYALVVGPGQVADRYSRGISDGGVSVNNTAYCVRGVGFKPKHVQVTARTPDAFPKAVLHEATACQGGTAVFFDGDLTYDDEFFIALWG